MQLVAPDEVSNLLTYCRHIAQAGDRSGALAVLRALSRQHPNNPHIQRVLETYTAHPPENPHALEPVPVSFQPQPQPQPQHPSNQRKIVLAAGIVLLLLVLVGSIGVLYPRLHQEGSQKDSGGFFAPAAPATPSPTPPPTIVPLGKPQTVGDWDIILLRPSYTQVLRGAVGPIQPAGKFVLVLLSVGNRQYTPRRIPPGMFILTDQQGRAYRTVTGASTTYLATYGRGQRGDLALEDPIPPHGMYSVPLLFDVPTDTADLLLMTVGSNEAWPIATR